MDYNQKVYWENNSICKSCTLCIFALQLSFFGKFTLLCWYTPYFSRMQFFPRNGIGVSAFFHPLLDYRILFTTWVFTFSAICGIRGGVRSNCLFLCESFLSDWFLHRTPYYGPFYSAKCSSSFFNAPKYIICTISTLLQTPQSLGYAATEKQSLRFRLLHVENSLLKIIKICSIMDTCDG